MKVTHDQLFDLLKDYINKKFHDPMYREIRLGQHFLNTYCNPGVSDPELYFKVDDDDAYDMIVDKYVVN